MKKKTNIRTMIRQIVREEVALAIHEVITELKQPTQKNEKIFKNKKFSKDPILNEVLNETATADEWKTLGGGTYDSSNMNEILGKSYGDMMNNSNDIAVAGQTADFLKKDCRGLMKKVDEKTKQKRGV